MSSEKKQQGPPIKIVKRSKIKIRANKKVKLKKKVDCNVLKAKYIDLKENEINIKDPEQQQLLKCISNENRNSLSTENKYNYLYPTLEDPNFNYKIANKKEFYDNRYEQKTPEQFQNIKEIAQMMCENTEFELEPHQMFVRNFMSFQTPYNGLLLFHGLGTGKTCSSISVCEEMRTYLQQLGITKRIIIVASPAVQKNFRIQLFNENKLKEVNGLWNIKACTGNKFIKEINPMNMKGLSRDKVIRQIKRIISQSYNFQGYVEFSNYIRRIMNRTVLSSDDDELKKRKQNRALQREFSNRMIVIDEVHNLRITNEGKIKPSSENLLRLVSNSTNLKILLLSATPMFNEYQEIIWLLNVLNLNDGRFPITVRDIFDSKGNFIENTQGEQIGKQLLIQKMTGYISYVRGNNPFTFPYSIYPNQANNSLSLKKLINDNIWTYPDMQLNGAVIVDPIEILDLAIVNIGSYQKRGYEHILESLKKKYPILNNPNKGLSYTVLDAPLQALNMVYPDIDLDNEDIEDDLYQFLYGKKGLDRVMLYDVKTRTNFRYKDITLQNFGRIFSPSEIGKYSSKIAQICDSIRNSNGIVFIYSQYIDGGAVPIALALEEMGFTKYGGNSLFKEPPVEPVDAITLSNKNVKFPAKYMMITGQANLTRNVESELKAITSENNINGEKIKVVIVSRAGSEGLDFKNIRQTHILDPWYNLNRQQQIIGRSVRNLSHCALPFSERNVEIFLYGTNMGDNVESADLYVYRLAERKAKKIATVVRLLKENAIDCLLNRKGQDFSENIVNKVVEQKLSQGNTIQYRIGDRDNSFICDFTSCSYQCNAIQPNVEDLDTTTYDETFIIMNMDKILQRIRILFSEYYIFDRKSLIAQITQIKSFPLEQIYSALSYLINEKNEYITDMLGRLGHLVNVGDYYMFQPVELGTKPITRFDRVVPLDFKRRKIIYNLPDTIPTYMQYDEEIVEEINESKETKQPMKIIRKRIVLKNISHVMNNLSESYKSLQTPSVIKSLDKQNWVKAASWAIYNLNKYNQIDKNLLVQFGMFHVIDKLDFNTKINILKEIYFKEDKNEIETIIKAYFDEIKIVVGEDIGIVIADFNSKKKEHTFKLIVYVNGKWVSNKLKVAKLARPLFEKYQIKDINLINDLIGFMTIFKGQEVVFKSKTMNLSEKGRTNKGQRCDRGEAKSVITARINKLLGGGVRPMKYQMVRSSIASIYGETNIKQMVKTGENKSKEVKLGTLQLCAESELIFRYYDYTKFEGKRWFFNTADALINNIVEKGK
jgi:hypothetical protein